MKYLLSLTLILACISAIFITEPNFDPMITNYFYDANDGFIYQNLQPFLFLKQFGLVVHYGFLPIMMFCLLFNQITKRRLLGLDSIRVVYLLAVFAIGPGFIIHNIIKPSFNRPRPVQIEEFGGQEEYTPAYSINSECQKCRSFISGHAGGAAAMMAFGYVYKNPRALIFLVTFTYSILMAIARIIQGAHFTSDVTIAIIMVMFVNHLLALVLLDDWKPKKK